MTVRYMPQAPEQAVTSWQEQGLAHGWVWASFMWVLGGIGLFGAVATVRSTAKTTRLVDSLVRDGKLLVAQVQQAEASGTAQAPALTVHFKTGPSEVIKQAFVLKRGGPLFANGEQLVVLASSDEKEAYALREDGYPLAELPDLTLLGITPTQPAEPDNQVEADSEEDEEEEEDEDDLAKAG